jgi:signal transduction histidine kinase
MEFDPEIFSPLVSIQKIISDIHRSYEKNLSVKIRYGNGDGDGHTTVKLDKNTFERIITNLIENAFKFTPENGEVEITVASKYNNLKVDVKDTGVGIQEEDLPKIFDEHYSKPDMKVSKKKGTGIGLAIVQHLIKAQNGQIWVSSKPGAGTTFTFILPFSTS